MEVIVGLPPAVRELTFRPLASSLKLPKAVLGTNPAIKLSVAGVHGGVNGAIPNSFVVEITRAARAGTANSNQSPQMNFATALNFGLCKLLMMSS